MAVALVVIAQYAAYMVSLAAIAWHAERRTGHDAFALVPALAVGIALSGLLPLPSWLAVAIAGPLCAAVCFLYLDWLFRRLSLTLLEILVVVLAVLAGFDWFTRHAPVAADGNTRSLAVIATVAAGLPWLRELLDRRSLTALQTRLGVTGAWALRFWGHGSQLGKAFWFPPLVLLAFFPAIILPLTTTGVLSGTILKDAVLAMLFARVCSSRSPVLLVAIALSVSIVRFAVAFGLASNFGPPAVEAGIYLGGLVWLRTHGFRVGIGGFHDR